MKDIVEQAKKEIPSVDEIIEATWKKLNFKKRSVLGNFGYAVVRFDEKATEEFRNYERKSLRKLAELWIKSQQGKIREKLKIAFEKENQDEFIQDLSKIFSDFGLLVQQLEKDLGNMRKARGGKTFEKSVAKLLNFIGIKCEMPKGENKEKLKRIDIVIPSEDLALNKPDKAIFITCKRTLRERWKQEVPSVGPNQRIYLITIDEEISSGKIEEIKKMGLIIFVRDEIKENFKDNDWVRKLSDLPKEVKIWDN